MSGDKIFIDTNICIYLLNGDTGVADFLNDQIVYISFVTEIELYAYHSSESATEALNKFINSVIVVNMSDAVKYHAIEIRKLKKVKIPDAIVAASALSQKLSLLTADKGFKSVDNLNVLLYAPRNP